MGNHIKHFSDYLINFHQLPEENKKTGKPHSISIVGLNILEGTICRDNQFKYLIIHYLFHYSNFHHYTPAIMKKLLLFIIICGTLSFYTAENTQAQKARLIGSNALNGGLTGAALGTATMFLNDDSNYSALRIGVGLGILGGTGVAVYDMVNLPTGQEPFIDGVFNESSNSSYIILLDTIYGAGFGSAIGAASAVIGNRSIVKGLQFGAGAGAWIGFGFGLMDSFIFADRNPNLTSGRLLNTESLYTINGQNTTIHFVQPDIFTYQNLEGNTLSLDIEPSINVISLRMSF